MSSGGYVQTFRKKCVKTRKKIEDSLFERASSEDIVSCSNSIDQDEIIIENHKFLSKQSRNGNPNSYMGIPPPPPIFSPQSVQVEVETHTFPITPTESNDDEFVEKLNPDWEFELDPLPEKDFDCNDHFKWVISAPEKDDEITPELEDKVNKITIPFGKGESSSSSSISRCSQIINSLKDRLKSPPKSLVQESQPEPQKITFSSHSYSGHDNSNSFIFLNNVHNNNPNSIEKLQENHARNEDVSADYDDDIIIASAQPQPLKHVMNERHPFGMNLSKSLISIPTQDDSENLNPPEQVSLRPRSIAAFTLDVDYDAITSLDIQNMEDEDETVRSKSNKNGKTTSFSTSRSLSNLNSAHDEQQTDFYSSFSGLANIIGCIPRVSLSNKAAMQLRSQQREMENSCHCHCTQRHGISNYICQQQEHHNSPLQSQSFAKNNAHSTWFNRRQGGNCAVISPYQQHRDQHDEDYSSDKFHKYYGQYSLTGINIHNANIDKSSKNGRKSSEELLLDRYHNHVHRGRKEKQSSGSVFKRSEGASSSKNLWENVSRGGNNSKAVGIRENQMEESFKSEKLPKGRLTKLKTLARNKWGKEQIVKRFQDDVDAGFSSSTSSTSSVSSATPPLKTKPKTRQRPKKLTSSLHEIHNCNSDETSTVKSKRSCSKPRNNLTEQSSSTSSLPISSPCEDDDKPVTKKVLGETSVNKSKRHRVRWRFPTSKFKRNVKLTNKNSSSSQDSSSTSNTSSSGSSDDAKIKSASKTLISSRFEQEEETTQEEDLTGRIKLPPCEITTPRSVKKRHSSTKASFQLRSSSKRRSQRNSKNQQSMKVQGGISRVSSARKNPTLSSPFHSSQQVDIGLPLTAKSSLSLGTRPLPKSSTSLRVFNASSVTSSSRSDASSSSFRSNSSSGYASNISTRTSFFLKSLRKRFIKTSNKVAVGDWEDEDAHQSLQNFKDVGRSLQGQNITCTCNTKRSSSRSRNKRDFILNEKKSYAETSRVSNAPVPPVFYVQPDIENISHVEKVYVAMGFDEVVLDLKSGEVKKACDGSVLFTTGPLCITSKKKGGHVNKKGGKIPSKNKKKQGKSVGIECDENDCDVGVRKRGNGARYCQSGAEEEQQSI